MPSAKPRDGLEGTVMTVTIGGKNYDYRSDIREDSLIRGSFNRLARETFGLDFEPWYQSGYWGGQYIPHVLLDGDVVAANVSVNLIPLRLLGRRKTFVQLGTVMTGERYRGQGLARFLMEKVLAEWKERCDAVYLFANDRVLGFYPKFGFHPADEYQACIPVSPTRGRVRRLHMSDAGDRALLLAKYRQSNPFSVLTMENNPGLLMFYCTQFLKEQVYYLEREDAAVIAEQDGPRMLCYDIFCGQGLRMEALLNAAADPAVRSAVLGFTPKTFESGSFTPLRQEDTTLFVLAGKEPPFAQNRLMFPLLSHA